MKPNDKILTEKKQSNLSIIRRPKIDSLKIRFTLDQVQILDPTLNQKYCKMYEDSGIIDEDDVSLEHCKVRFDRGISTRIGISNYVRPDKVQVQNLYIQINAKMLQEDYLYGIHYTNIHKVYSYLMDFQIIYIPFDVFLKGFVSDVDVCWDDFCSPSSFTNVITKLLRRIRSECYKYIEEPFKKKTNVGINFNKRAKATPGKPHCKFYHKGLELKHNVKKDDKGNKLPEHDFRKIFLPKENVDLLARYEFTIKNSKAKKSLDLEFRTLKQLLEVREIELQRAIFEGLDRYILKKQKYMLSPKRTDLTPALRNLANLIELAANLGATKSMIYDAVLDSYDPKTEKKQKQRSKKDLNTILEGHIDIDYQLIENKESDDFLRHLGVE